MDPGISINAVDCQFRGWMVMAILLVLIMFMHHQVVVQQ